MLPGVQQRSSLGQPAVIIDGIEEDYDLHAELGSPAFPVQVTVWVLAGGVVTSSTAAIPAFDHSGFVAGSSVVIYLEGGEVRGAGGDGGLPEQDQGGSVVSGGGGGGGGTDFGVGGEGYSGAPANTIGGDGDAETGGAGGTVAFVTPPFGRPNGTDGEDGGTAIDAGDVPTTVVTRSGILWGGGGGGGGGGGNPNFGGNGGAVGQAGTSGAGGNNGAGGAAGYAIKGTDVTEVPGSADVRGPVGP